MLSLLKKKERIGGGGKLSATFGFCRCSHAMRQIWLSSARRTPTKTARSRDGSSEGIFRGPASALERPVMTIWHSETIGLTQLSAWSIAHSSSQGPELV